MLDYSSRYIPVLSSEAGLCLTAANWEEMGVKVGSYSLENLLFKPGLAFLQEITNLSSYLGWKGSLVLNAQNLIANKEGIFRLKSPLDGSMLSFNAAELIKLINSLNPSAALLPKGIALNYPELWDNWSSSIIPFVHEEDSYNVKQSYGSYLMIKSTENGFEQCKTIPNLQYVTGSISLSLMPQISNKLFIESDEPARDALLGKVYSSHGTIDLLSKNTELQNTLIDSECACPTCSQQFTQSYLHHLLLNTPLLCHRLLIQHNVFFVRRKVQEG